MHLPKEAWQEYLLEPGPQDLPPGYDPHSAPSGITEDHASVQVIEVISDNTIPSTVDLSNHTYCIHQVSHSNSVKNPTEINPHAATLASPSG